MRIVKVYSFSEAPNHHSKSALVKNNYLNKKISTKNDFSDLSFFLIINLKYCNIKYRYFILISDVIIIKFII